jgi:hypothetical protein
VLNIRPAEEARYLGHTAFRKDTRKCRTLLADTRSSPVTFSPGAPWASKYNCRHRQRNSALPAGGKQCEGCGFGLRSNTPLQTAVEQARLPPIATVNWVTLATSAGGDQGKRHQGTYARLGEICARRARMPWSLLPGFAGTPPRVPRLSSGFCIALI